MRFLRLNDDKQQDVSMEELPRTSDTSMMMVGVVPPPKKEQQRIQRRQKKQQQSHRDRQTSVTAPTTSIWQTFWKCSRRWLCTSGWYPFLVSLIATSGFVLSLYSSSGCQFVDISVGFTPNNLAWNDSRAELGLFYYHNRTVSSSSVSSAYETSNDLFYNGCIWYTDVFQEKVIDRDRTWRVARIMAMIAVSSSLLVTLTVWMIVVTPIPTACIWPGLLLPNTMLSFIAEGSKFLLFDIALCRKDVWFPSGVDSLPEMAEQCQLGSSAFAGIAAGTLHLMALVCICLRSPQKRTMDPSYGIYPSNSSDAAEGMDRSSAFRNDYYGDDSRFSRNKNNVSLANDPSLLDEDIYTEGPSPANNSLVLLKSNDHPDNKGQLQQDYTSQDDSSDPMMEEDEETPNNMMMMTTKKFTFPTTKQNDTAAKSTRTTSSSSSFSKGRQHQLPLVALPPPPRISESRIAVLSKLDVSSNHSTTTLNQNTNKKNRRNSNNNEHDDGSDTNGSGNTSSSSQQQRMIEDLLSELDTSLAVTATDGGAERK